MRPNRSPTWEICSRKKVRSNEGRGMRALLQSFHYRVWHFASVLWAPILLILIAVLTIRNVQLSAEEVYPHTGSSLFFRVTNRKYISHLVFESIDRQNYITLITTHAGVWAFQSRSHALHYPCGSATECLAEMRRLNDFLDSGWNIGLRLNGSIITEIIYYDPDGS